MKSGTVYAAAVLTLAGSLLAAPSLAEGPSNAIVKARQASMKEMAAAAKAIAEMFDGKRAYEPAAFRAAAGTLSTRTGPALIAEFPAGTLGAPSAAKPEVDQARPEFEALARHIGRLAEALAAKAEEAPAAIGDDMRMGTGLPMDGGSLLGKRPNAAAADPARMPAEHLLHLILQDCASCHSKFRLKVE
ncbi:MULTISPECIES: cytochrome c [unclassified Mesorhizobium]|uniref:cytochrome c n=2 Tax=Mesorhizobium TaxID=68287 RepID=UPI000FCC5291|nr:MULTISPECIES: cytochrome c [unclassified Mesorhizobium]TIT79412.1 MAG: cytochrome c [Mesorhizobium sp.]TGP21805.1 cytochrome c [Mesorhizobium sp. M1D.F.Ca.ET.231.01.1.1]TGP29905.1 cytochrome c [Mesorhizobium sp. M1D.F.Ca.ET.234.01.1.1]TGS44270.1 cytochrome c [Mesorhizobium sp. M1D.F.Ca.ET.184.01.1.1]TGS60287.1 cytochrome c [Mesorhizobium sp. M1D.F.Ca.ET.183.01.1.1]